MLAWKWHQYRFHKINARIRFWKCHRQLVSYFFQCLSVIMVSVTLPPPPPHSQHPTPLTHQGYIIGSKFHWAFHYGMGGSLNMIFVCDQFMFLKLICDDCTENKFAIHNIRLHYSMVQNNRVLYSEQLSCNISQILNPENEANVICAVLMYLMLVFNYQSTCVLIWLLITCYVLFLSTRMIVHKHPLCT